MGPRGRPVRTGASAVAAAAAIALHVVAIAAPTPAYAADTVIVMRHCIRSTTFKEAGPYPHADNYTAKPWPRWPVDNPEDYLCLPRGEDIITGEGRELAGEAFGVPRPIMLTVDDVSRDRTTAARVVEGLGSRVPAGMQAAIDPRPFSPTPACARNSSEFMAFEHREVAASFTANNFTDSQVYADGVAKLQRIVGTGVSGPLDSIPCNVTGAKLWGGCAVATDFAEELIMQWGGGIAPMGWGRATGDDVRSLVQLHSISRQVTEMIPAVQAMRSASITRMVVSALGDRSANGTQVFVGHDTQLWGLGATLGLAWIPDDGAWPADATIPGSFLRFDRTEDGAVMATYNYVKTFDSADGKLGSTRVTWLDLDGHGHAPGGGSDRILFPDLEKRMASRTDEKCAYTQWNATVVVEA